MTKVGLYLRVSTHQQNTESQLTALKLYCQANSITDFEIFQDEGISGVKQSRPALDELMTKVRERGIGTVIVYSFSRFARSTTHLLTALDEFNSLGVAFVSISEKLDSHTPHGRMVFSILSAIAELERHLIKDRVKAGIANARLKGKRIGAPKKPINTELLSRLISQDLSYKEISKLVGVSAATICRTVKTFQKGVAL